MVYEGTGTASGYFVYTYQIELYDTTASSIGFVTIAARCRPKASRL
jgi:hypothetical protein